MYAYFYICCFHSKLRSILSFLHLLIIIICTVPFCYFTSKIRASLKRLTRCTKLLRFRSKKNLKMANSSFRLDFNVANEKHIETFIKEVMDEITTMVVRLNSRIGHDFGRLNAYLFTEYVIFFGNHSLHCQIKNLKQKTKFSYQDSEVRKFIYEIFYQAYVSPISLRAKDPALWHAFESLGFYNSRIFNTTANIHQADPRIYLRK